ncbi:hypothetical protein QKC54_gp0065 [Megavirus baoshan]|uniref:Uncharacterized protein n=1 Tax=Megavirus baoshan TaxID=2496520 RepID=A0A3Q8U907_9VIRU|nr:hypothetical protein QKC54_gp0065 [Megavirus baoshan]AZL89842.1 hypothetical protein Mb1007 [Megavirus baoshan]
MESLVGNAVAHAGNVYVNNFDQKQVDIDQKQIDSKISNSTDIVSKIEFDNGEFNYVVEFITKNSSDNTITIKCTHKEEFYCWSFTTNDIIKTSSLINKQDTAFNINIKPEMLFNIFSDYKNNTLNKIYRIKFPVKFDSHESSITIELSIVLPMMDSYVDTKFITLYPKKIDEVERCSLKFMRLNHLIEQKNQENIQKINKEIEEIHVTQSAFSKYVREKYAKIDDLPEDSTEGEKEIEFIAQLKKFLTKPQHVIILIDALKPTLNNYVTKEYLETELEDFALESEYVSKKDYGNDKPIFARKADLDKYVLKPV